MLLVGTLQECPGKRLIPNIILKIIRIQRGFGCCPSRLLSEVCPDGDIIQADIMTLLRSVPFCGDKAAARQSMNDALTDPVARAETLEAALQDLKELGISVPRRPTLRLILIEVCITSALLRLRGNKQLSAMIEMKDQRQIAISLKIDHSISMAFFRDPLLAAFLVSRQIRILLKHGYGEAAARSLALLGVMQNSSHIRQYSSAAVCARLATRVATVSRPRNRQDQVSSDWKGLLFPWTYPRRLTTKLIRQQLGAIANSAELSTTAFSIDYELLSDMFTWDTLGKVLECADAALEWTNGIKGSNAARNTMFLAKIVGRVANAKTDSNVFSSHPQPDEGFLNVAESDGDIVSVSFHWSLIGAMAAIWGKHDEASLAYGHLKTYQRRYGLLAPVSPQCRFLMIYAAVVSLRAQGRDHYRELLKLLPDIGFVYHLAKANPSGFSWAWNLLCAEFARIFGQVERAFKYYRMARSRAKDSGYLLPLAFVQECLGRFSYEEHDEVLAGQQLREACQFYSLWGSEAKVSQLSREFSQISSLRSERQVIGTMRASESAQDVIHKLDIRSVRSKSRLQSESSNLSAIVDHLMQKGSEKNSGRVGMIALLDEYIEEAKTKSRVNIDQKIGESFRRGVLPVQAADIPGIDLEFFYQAAQHIGGDFLGYHYDSKSGHLCLQIGDVSGIGASAVLVSTAVSASLAIQYESLFASIGRSVDEAVFQLARAANTAVERFGKPLNCLMTMSFIVLNIRSGQGSFLNAAHMPFYFKQKGKVTSLLQRGLQLGELGFLEHCLVSRFQFEHGDSLFLYTDGLIKNKSISGQSLSRRRIREIIGESTDSQSVYRNILAAYSDKTANNPPIDDTVFLSVGRHV